MDLVGLGVAHVVLIDQRDALVEQWPAVRQNNSEVERVALRVVRQREAGVGEDPYYPPLAVGDDLGVRLPACGDRAVVGDRAALRGVRLRLFLPATRPSPSA